MSKSAVLLFCIALILGWHFSHGFGTFREPSNVSIGCPQLAESQLGYFAIKNLVQNPDCQIKSVETLLPRLPGSFRSRYALMYLSRSKQGPHVADYLHPRVIFYGANNDRETPGRFFLTFNGNPSDLGFNSVEMMEAFLEKGVSPEDMFQLNEIVFPAKANELSWQEVQQKIVFDERPTNCLACHGSPAHGIFDGYPQWDGSYGSRDGLSSENQKILALELENFDQFSASISPNSRYASLVYLNGFTQELSESEKAHYAVSRTFNKINTFDGPSMSLNRKLSLANHVRIVREIMRTPDYEKYKYAYLAAWFPCNSTSDFIPENLRPVHERNVRGYLGNDGSKDDEQIKRELSDSRKEQLRFYSTLTLRQLYLNTSRIQQVRFAAEVIYVRYLFEGRNIDIRNWFLDLVQPAYSIYNGGGEKGLMTAWASEDPSLKGLISSMYDAYREDNLRVQAEKTRLPALCDKVQQLSLDALKNFDPSQVTIAAPKSSKPSFDFHHYPLTFVNTCASCHDHGPGPYIEFLKPDILAAHLKANPKFAQDISDAIHGVAIYPMPANRRLNDEELKDIDQYLKKFLK